MKIAFFNKIKENENLSSLVEYFTSDSPEEIIKNITERLRVGAEKIKMINLRRLLITNNVKEDISLATKIAEWGNSNKIEIIFYV